jgi:hypothetical protein
MRRIIKSGKITSLKHRCQEISNRSENKNNEEMYRHLYGNIFPEKYSKNEKFYFC